MKRPNTKKSNQREDWVTWMLNQAPATWNALWDGNKQMAQATRLRDALDSVAIHATRLSAYLNARAQGHTHTVAVRYQNSAAAKVRRALGYTIARADLNI